MELENSDSNASLHSTFDDYVGTFFQTGVWHRLSNPGLILLEVIEVQIGEYLTEDDIIRVEEDYRRG